MNCVPMLVRMLGVKGPPRLTNNSYMDIVCSEPGFDFIKLGDGEASTIPVPDTQPSLSRVNVIAIL